MKKKSVVKSGSFAINFDEKLFFGTNLRFNSHWEYKHYDEFFNKKLVYLNITNKIQLKSDVIDGSILRG